MSETITTFDNVIHNKDEILKSMDDDDFYPPDKISYTVDKMMDNCELISGSTIMYAYYICYKKVLKFGPYGRNHATCGTIAFKKEFLKDHRFDETCKKAEERSFLNNFRIPLLQLDPMKTILCISHLKNTVDKHKTVTHKQLTNLTLDEFNVSKGDKVFYEELLSQQGGEFIDITKKLD